MPHPARRRAAALGLALLPAAFSAASVHAQTTPVRRDSLPPLAPRELEIRGEMRVSLPSIVRPPLDGFGIAPAPLVLDARRQPREAPYVVRGLPGSPLAPPPPPDLPALVLPTARRGTVEAGAGRDLARFGTVFLAAPLSRVSHVDLEASYDGHDARSGRPGSQANAARGRLGYHVGTGAGRLDAVLDGRGLARGLFGAAPFAGTRGGADGGLRLDLAHATPDRTLAARGWVRAAAFDPDDGPGADFRSQDRHAGGRLAATLHRLGAAGDVGVGVDARVEGGQTTADTRTRRIVAADAGVGLELALARGGTLRGGPRVLVGRDSLARTVPTLALDLRLPLTATLGVVASNAPEAAAGRFADLVFAEPFVAPRTAPAATLRPVDARVGLAVTQGSMVVSPWAGYRYATRATVWRQRADGALVDALHGALREPVVGLDVTLSPRRPLWAGLVGLRASAEARQPTFDTGSGDVDAPGRGLVGASLGAWGRAGVFTMGLTVEGETARPADVTGSRTAPAWADLDVYLSASVTPLVAVVVRLDNLAATRRWAGFRESDRLGQIGLSIRW